MENKKYIIFLLIIISICFLLVGYFNYEKIVGFFNAKEWEFAESFATIKIENISQVEAGKKLIVYANNKLDFYGNSSKSEYSENMKITEFISNTYDDYLVMIPRETNEIYLFRDSELIWKNKFNGNILNASVNKNGYVTVIYSQSGYKIKIFKPTGEELFTTYLGSTYALDVEMSNDNKTLYIAEIDTEGIKIKSNIKIIDISNIGTNINLSPSVENISLGVDELITDIEYTNANSLLILKDSGIDYLNAEKELEKIIDLDIKNTLFVSIDNVEAPIVIEKVSTGIFTNETSLKIFKDDKVIEEKIDRTPQTVDTAYDKIALNLGEEVIFLNNNGKVVKRYELENQLLSVKLYNKSNLAALVFRDRIELVKL